MKRKPPDLDSAYGLQTPADNRALYADWADTYDSSFAVNMEYQLPRRVAEIIDALEIAGRMLDVGAGTGLLAECLATRERFEIDALDISPQMLAVAMQKRLYQKAIEADLTQPLPLKSGTYDAVASSGTFTHGHVGPDALDALLRVAKTGARFVLAINAEHYSAKGFEAKFALLGPAIDQLRLHDVAIYGSGADPAHRHDRSIIASFRKL